MPRFRLWVVFSSFQWPLRDGDYIEVCPPEAVGEPIARIPAELIEALLAHHIQGLAVQSFLAQTTAQPPQWHRLPHGFALDGLHARRLPPRREPAEPAEPENTEPPPAPPKRKPLARVRDRLYDPARVAALRARRRSRKPKGGA